MIKDLFLGRIQYSENGTTNKIKEVDTYIQFGDYLEECKGNIQVIKRVKDMFYVINIHISRWWRGSLRRCVKFFCGASKIPPLGFDSTPALSFSDSAIYPTASTCALHLTLPTKYHSNYSLFKEKMTQAITCHGGFGML